MIMDKFVSMTSMNDIMDMDLEILFPLGALMAALGIGLGLLLRKFRNK